MKKEVNLVQVNTCAPIDTEQIPDEVGMILAQSLLDALHRAYANPEIQADFQRWLAERKKRNEN